MDNASLETIIRSVSIPAAGEIGLTDTSVFRDTYAVVRVVKASAIGKMWMIEQYRRGVFDRPGYWDRPVRRKVNVWMPLGSCDAAAADKTISERRDQFWKDQKKLEAEYKADVVNLVQTLNPGVEGATP